MRIRKVGKKVSPDGDRECNATTFFTADEATIEYYTEVAPFDAKTCEHEVAHALRRRGDDLHHPRWHFCILAPTTPWRWGLTWACSGTTPREKAIARVLFVSEDDVFLEA